jgi:hypothetical protein
VLCVFTLLPSLAPAQVTVVREGDENPMLTVAKSTFWGSVTGLLIGGAIALVVEDNKGDQVKWGFVVGTIGGCAFGFYHVFTREPPTTGLLDAGPEGLAWSLPEVHITVDAPATGPQAGSPRVSARVPLVTVSF